MGLHTAWVTYQPDKVILWAKKWLVPLLLTHPKHVFTYDIAYDTRITSLHLPYELLPWCCGCFFFIFLIWNPSYSANISFFCVKKAIFAPTDGVIYKEYGIATFIHSPNYVINPLVYTYIWLWSALEHAASYLESVIYPDLAGLEAGMEMVGHQMFVHEMVCMNKTWPSYAIPPCGYVVGAHDNSNQQGLTQWIMKMVE